MPSTWRVVHQLHVLAALTTVAGAFVYAPSARSASLQSAGRVQDLMPRYSTAGDTVLRKAGEEKQDDTLAKVLAPSEGVRKRPEGGGGGGGRPPRSDNRGDFNNRRGGNNAGNADPDRPPMNEQLLRIAPKEVRCLVSNPEEGDIMLGVLPTQDALQKAKDLGLDLIMISDTAVPPVVKIIDYGKFKYSLEKKKKEQKKRAKTTEVKEVKMSYKIEAHDYGVRIKQMTKFIEEGDRVKVVIQFRGREQQHIDLGQELLQKLSVELKDIGSMEGDIRREGNRLTAMWKPKGR